MRVGKGVVLPLFHTFCHHFSGRRNVLQGHLRYPLNNCFFLFVLFFIGEGGGGGDGGRDLSTKKKKGKKFHLVDVHSVLSWEIVCFHCSVLTVNAFEPELVLTGQIDDHLRRCFNPAPLQHNRHLFCIDKTEIFVWIVDSGLI